MPARERPHSRIHDDRPGGGEGEGRGADSHAGRVALHGVARRHSGAPDDGGGTQWPVRGRGRLIQTISLEENRMNRLQGKVTVVTGASKGIGASIAEHLAAEGAAVVVNYAASKAGADAVVRRINDKGGKAVAIQADVSRPDDIKRLFAQAQAAYG